MAPYGRGDGYGPQSAHEPADASGSTDAFEAGATYGPTDAFEAGATYGPTDAFEAGAAYRAVDAYGATDAYGPGDAYGAENAHTTQPLPELTRHGVPRRGGRRLRRFLYRATLTVVSVLACLVIGFGLLLVFTPSAGQATRIAAQLAREHHVAYPGPAVAGELLPATGRHRGSPVLLRGWRRLTRWRSPGSRRARSTGGPDQGGATIDLQLAKLLYIGDNSPRHDTLQGKLIEVALAVKLSAMYSKPQILQLYAEVAYYGHGYYGLAAGELRVLRAPCARPDRDARRDARWRRQRPHPG